MKGGANMESDFEIVNWERYFALNESGNLVCVTVYKKGAEEVKRRIEELKNQIGEAQRERPETQLEKEVNHVE
jgi:hypothetical protein